MTQTVWAAVDDYLEDLYVHSDSVLESAIQTSAAAGLPGIQVTPSQGMLLHILARMQKAGKILEIGTLGGYSTIWLARALPEGGRLLSLEAEPSHAAVARANLENAGLSGKVEVRVGRAIETLPGVAERGEGPFDLIFIDADKMSIAEYFTWALRLSRPGSLIIVDNVVRKGAVIDAQSDDPAVQGVRRFNELAAAQRGVLITTIQTVGRKGYDGFTLVYVLGDAPAA